MMKTVYIDQMIYSYFVSQNNDTSVHHAHALKQALIRLVRNGKIIAPYSQAHISAPIPIKQRIIPRLLMLAGLSKSTYLSDGISSKRNPFDDFIALRSSEISKKVWDINLDQQLKKGAFFGLRPSCSTLGLSHSDFSNALKNGINPLALIDRKLQSVPSISTKSQQSTVSEDTSAFVEQKMQDVADMYHLILEKIKSDNLEANNSINQMKQFLKDYVESLGNSEFRNLLDDLFEEEIDDTIQFPSLPPASNLKDLLLSTIPSSLTTVNSLPQARDMIKATLSANGYGSVAHDILIDTQILDSFGFHSDKNKEKKKRKHDLFWQELWDLNHLKEALSCDYFITADNSLYHRFKMSLLYHHHNLRPMLLEDSVEFFKEGKFS